MINLKEIINTITPDTPLETVVSYCKTVEDFEIIFSEYCTLHKDDKSINMPISAKLKQAALKIAGNGECFNTAYLQRNLKIPYLLAAALYDWLEQNIKAAKIFF